MVYKRHIPALVLSTGAVAASAYAIHRNARRREARLHKEDLKTCEGEGGKPASPTAGPVRSS